MSRVEPDWSEKVDEGGTPVDPLGTDRSRNRVVNLFSRGLITSITLRLRYLSIHAWALKELTGLDLDDGERYDRLKRIEKLFCLTSHYQHLAEDQPRGATIAGMDGVNNFSSYNYEEFDEIHFDDFELLKNDSYGYPTNYENLLQKLLLKRGGFDLTAAGKELADIVRKRLAEENNRVLECANRGYATRDDFEALREPFANQSLYLSAGRDDERRAFEKVLLGFLEWQGDEQTGTVALQDSVPETIPLDLLDDLQDTLDEPDDDPTRNRLNEKYRLQYHDYRRGFGLFLLRARQLQTETDADPIALTPADKDAFDDFRELMRIYWMQVYTGYALESQLEALCTFLNSRIPARHPYETLLERATDGELLQRELAGLFDTIEIETGSDEASSDQLVRNLLLYGEASRNQPTVSIPSGSPSSTITLGTVREEARTIADAGWDATQALAGEDGYNEVLLGKAIRASLDELQADLNDVDRQFEWWTRSLARSILLLVLCVERFDHLKQERNWLFEYAHDRLHSRFSSLPRLYHEVLQTDPGTPLDQFAYRLFDDFVVESHLRVFYNRLSPGNLKRVLSFDQDNRLCLEAQKDRGDRPFTASPSFVRFDEMNVFLRDCGLLVDDDDEGYLVTDRARELLERLEGGPDE